MTCLAATAAIAGAMKLRQEPETNLVQLNADTEWGFLKNIVNINTFFGTGDSSCKDDVGGVDANSLA